MNDPAIDRFARLLGADATRRGAVHALMGTALVAPLGLDSWLTVAAAAAKGKGKKRRRCKPKPAGTPCTTDKDCCTTKTGRVCRQPAFSTGQEPTVCCATLDEPCPGGTRDCCDGFACDANDGNPICRPEP